MSNYSILIDLLQTIKAGKQRSPACRLKEAYSSVSMESFALTVTVRS